MSIVRILEHDENIYSIKGEDRPVITKPSHYISRFRHQVTEEVKRNKDGHRTLGLAEVPRENPSDYLKKFSRPVPPRPIIDEPRCLISHRRPPLPPRIGPTTQVAEAGGGTKNYPLDNVVRAVRQVPRQPEKLYADTKTGDLHPLETSGLMPKFTLKKSYGKLPNYLKGYVRETQEKLRKLREEQDREKPGVRYISQMERKDMLEGMKHNWHEQMGVFLALPMMIDTPAKINRKAKLEAELKQLEHDIRMLERHPIIYVVDDLHKHQGEPNVAWY